MKKNIIFYISILCVIIVFSACGQNNSKQAQLKKLEAQREALTTKIEQLKVEIGDNIKNPTTAVSITLVRLENISPKIFNHFVRIQGLVESDNNILVPPKTPGVVKKIHVRIGDKVNKNQLLVELDGSILESSMEELKNGLSFAKTISERQERLWKKNIGSEIQYLQAKNTKEGLEKRLITVQEQYKMTKITAPINGTIDTILVKEGEMAIAGKGAVRIVQLSLLKVTASLAENYISKIKVNDKVKVEIPVVNQTFEHMINAVSQVIDINNRTFDIEIRVPVTETYLKPNMLAVITINDYFNEQALVVPQNIVQETGTEKFLFIAERDGDGWIARKRIVKSGEIFDNQTEIIQGIRPGEKVVVVGFQGLADGSKIMPDTTK